MPKEHEKPSVKEALARIALELERGYLDPEFFDRRGGFSAVIRWHGSVLSKGYWPESREQMQLLLDECADFLRASESGGWDAVALKRAEQLAAKLKIAK